MLKRPLYGGRLVYNRTKKRLPDGSRRGRQKRKPESEWIALERPELRIVAPDVVQAVDERLAGRRHA